MMTAAAASMTAPNNSWAAIGHIVDRVHTHVCGYSTLSVMSKLLHRNDIISSDSCTYLTSVVEYCSTCRATSLPQTSRKVSLASLSQQFNDLVCIDLLFLDGARVFYAMDSGSRHSAGTVCINRSVRAAITVLEKVWLSSIWPPDGVQDDQAFKPSMFTTC